MIIRMTSFINVQDSLPASIFIMMGYLQLINSDDVMCPMPCTCSVTKPENDLIIVIYCQNRDLTSLPDFSLLKGRRIDKILLDGNKIEEIHARSFHGVNVRSISFEENPLSKVNESAFSGSVGITNLNFNGCKLTGIPQIFEDLPELQTIKFSRNNISHIEPATFEPIKNLRSIDLGFNSISKLDFISDLCAYRKAFTSFVLTENPIHCTCSVYDLLKSHTTQFIGATCQSPPEYQGLYLSNEIDEGEEDTAPFLTYAAKSCRDWCYGSEYVSYDCKKRIWTDGRKVNCITRPVCSNDDGKLECQQGSDTPLIGPPDSVAYTEDEDDDDDDYDVMNANYNARPKYLRIDFIESAKRHTSSTASFIDHEKLTHIYFATLLIIAT